MHSTNWRRSGRHWQRALNVFKEGSIIDRIPAEGLKRLTLVGNVNLTGAVLDFLIRQRVETVFMTPTGRFRARLGIDDHRHVSLRKAQYLKLSDKRFAVETARLIVSGKVRNMSRLLLLRGRQYGDQILRTATVGLRTIVVRLEKADELERIRGLEGVATRIYFQCFERLIRNERFSFNGRNRRPPLDPSNVYTPFIWDIVICFSWYALIS